MTSRSCSKMPAPSILLPEARTRKVLFGFWMRALSSERLLSSKSSAGEVNPHGTLVLKKGSLSVFFSCRRVCWSDCLMNEPMVCCVIKLAIDWQGIDTLTPFGDTGPLATFGRQGVFI